MDPKIFDGGIHNDFRGSLTYFNDLAMNQAKRFYIIENIDTEVVRAWQGHKIEQKWFHVVSGSFKIVIVRPDNWNLPSPILNYHEFILEARKPQVLHVPGGYATGFMANSIASKVMVFSDFTVEESKNDDFRFDKGLWYNW